MPGITGSAGRSWPPGRAAASMKVVGGAEVVGRAARGRRGRPWRAARRRTASPRGVEGRGHPVGVDLEAGEQLGGLAGGDDGPAQQGAQGGPLGVPGAVGALVDRRPRRRGGAWPRARGGSARRGGSATASTGLGLCGIVDEPPPVPSASSPISGRRQREHVVGDPAPGVGAADERVAEPGDGDRAVCQGGRGGEPERGGQLEGQRGGGSDRVVERPASSTIAARVPAAPPTCTGKHEPPR